MKTVIHLSIQLFFSFYGYLILCFPCRLSFLDMVISQLQLHQYHTGRESRVVTALNSFKVSPFQVSTFSIDIVLSNVALYFLVDDKDKEV